MAKWRSGEVLYNKLCGHCHKPAVGVGTVLEGRVLPLEYLKVSEARGSECRKQAALAKRILHKHGLDYVAEFIVGPRDMHHVIDVLYNRADPDEMQRADTCFNELLDEFEKEGYAVYRVATRFQERVARSYGAVKRSLEHAIKRAVDPNNILAPGRAGIDLENTRKT